MPDMPSVDFCAEWNPEYPLNGYRCCRKVVTSKKKRRDRCSAQRAKGSYCSEMTEEQREYAKKIATREIIDPLDSILKSGAQGGDQSYCTVNNGFLAWGRGLIPTEENRIFLKSPHRCTNFGTDPMVGMLEWLGRQVKREYGSSQYSGVRLLVGDISAPRGGCLSGSGGRRGHLSHTTGQDADVGFLIPKPGARSPENFHLKFDPVSSWWMLKQVFSNPFACIKVIFLDRKLIGKLAKQAQGDPDWEKYGRFIRHMPGHKNHFHIRIGEGSGAPGCAVGSDPELEYEENGETFAEFITE